jgi:hypothetical protein
MENYYDEVVPDLDLQDYFKHKKLTPASLDNVQNILDTHTCAMFSWGVKDDEILVDAQTAQAVMVCYNALTAEENKAKFQRMIKASRNQFIKIVDFCWSHIK